MSAQRGWIKSPQSVPTPSADLAPHLFSLGEKPLAQRDQENLKKTLKPGLGESLEDLHWECQHDLLQKTLLNPVQENLEDLLAPLLPARPGTGMSTVCSTISCWSEE